MPSVGREPFHLFTQVPAAQIAFAGTHLPVRQGCRLVREGPGYILEIGVKLHLDLLLPAEGRIEHIVGYIFQYFRVPDGRQHPGSVIGIAESPVERNVLLDLQIVHRPFQRPPALAVFIGDAEQFLHVQKGDGSSGQGSHAVIPQIALQFRQIQRPPGTKDIVLPTPTQEVLHHLGEGLPPLQFFHAHVNQLAGDPVHTPINRGADQLAELTDHDPLLIQFDGTDLYDLKGQFCRFRLLPRAALIPLQIQNNIIHFALPQSPCL